MPNENCTCVNGDQKTCAGALNKLGSCGLDTATCVAGKWTGCTDSKGTDTCDRGNDNNCNGNPNENCVCINGDTGKCGDKLGTKGQCAGGTTTCASGQWGTCDRSPKATDACVFGNDDLCNGVPVGSPGNTQCQCGGFTMPNPSNSGLPNLQSYKDNGDGTVTDNVTGLLWERTANSASYSEPDAANHCLSKGPGWRLPTRMELVSVVDFTKVYPVLPINPVFLGTVGDIFWTSSTYLAFANSVYVVQFTTGGVGSSTVPGQAFVRCVSAGSAPPKCYPNRYQFRTAGEVYDAATGLTWQQSIDSNTYNWQDGKLHCSGIWRLPSISELQTIVDDTRTSPTADPIAFPNTPDVQFWTSTPTAGDPTDNAWPVNFADGETDSTSDFADMGSKYHVRCVR
ncbi:MAG TPA: DUF1566 domain-containing protein [Polyangia bacterium]|nr:DUF1566 domain-containing protein [Polyangia bacterium]